MSKFFTFHKNQQQQYQPLPHQQQQQQQQSSFFPDHASLSNLLDSNRMSSQMLDQQTPSGEKRHKLCNAPRLVL